MVDLLDLKCVDSGVLGSNTACLDISIPGLSQYLPFSPLFSPIDLITGKLVLPQAAQIGINFYTGKSAMLHLHEGPLK